jgi:hypothetical protein
MHRENIKLAPVSVPLDALVRASDAQGNTSAKRIKLDHFEASMQDEGPPLREDPLAPAKGLCAGLVFSLLLALFGCACFWLGWWVGGRV